MSIQSKHQWFYACSIYSEDKAPFSHVSIYTNLVTFLFQITKEIVHLYCANSN